MGKRRKSQGNNHKVGSVTTTHTTPNTPPVSLPAPPISSPPHSRDYERELKELEVQKKQGEVIAQNYELAQKTNWWSRWNNPVVLAILAGFAGYIGTLITWSLARSDEAIRHQQTLDLETIKQQATERLQQEKQKATERLEQKKLEGTLILDAIKTGEGPGRQNQAAANLVFLADNKLITLDSNALKLLKENSEGVGPGLPSAEQSLRSKPETEIAQRAIQADAAYAVSILNNLFAKQIKPPNVVCIENDWNEEPHLDRKTNILHASPAVSLIPDLTYRQTALLYLPEWELGDDETGALIVSSLDVFASVLRQKRMDQTAKTADWVIGTRYFALYDLNTKDASPMRSLKAPGKAFANDNQVDHMSKYVHTPITPDPQSYTREMYRNGGIPNKAFYNAAMQIGTEKAAIIWAKAISAIVERKPTFLVFARETIRQAEVSHGAEIRKLVHEAWKKVGIEPVK